MANVRPRVLFDVQNDNPSSGIGQYVRHIAGGIAGLGRYDVRGVLHKKSSSGFGFPLRQSGVSRRLIYDNRAFSALCPFSYERLAGVGDVDCLVFPTNAIPRVRVCGRMVAVIHDMLPIRIREFMRREGHGEHWFRTYEDRYRRIVDRADVICTVSDYTRQDLMRTFGVGAERFCLVPPGADLGQFSARDEALDAAVAARLGLPEKYVLYVGADREYKNVDGLLRGFAEMPEDVRRDLHLVFSHGVGTHRPLVESLGLSDRVRFLGGIAEADKASVYRRARAFAFLSYFEGFGMPALEAMAAGVPVVVSDRASLPEVVGEAGLVVPPDDAGAVAGALVTALADEDRRARLIAAGRERAKVFTWEASVAKMAAAIDRALEGRGA